MHGSCRNHFDCSRDFNTVAEWFCYYLGPQPVGDRSIMGFQSEAPPPIPPRFGPTYSQDEHNRLTRAIEMLINIILANGVFRATRLNLSNLPTSPVGLRSGDVWVNGTILEIVP